MCHDVVPEDERGKGGMSGEKEHGGGDVCVGGNHMLNMECMD